MARGAYGLPEMNLDELIRALTTVRHRLGRGDVHLIATVNMGEYEITFERVLYAAHRDLVILDDGSLKYTSHNAEYRLDDPATIVAGLPEEPT